VGRAAWRQRQQRRSSARSPGRGGWACRAGEACCPGCAQGSGRGCSAPAGSAPAGSAPAGSAPAGSAPAGSAPAGSAPAGSARPACSRRACGTRPDRRSAPDADHVVRDGLLHLLACRSGRAGRGRHARPRHRRRLAHRRLRPAGLPALSADRPGLPGVPPGRRVGPLHGHGQGRPDRHRAQRPGGPG
jgi:hypothetical protein